MSLDSKDEEISDLQAKISALMDSLERSDTEELHDDLGKVAVYIVPFLSAVIFGHLCTIFVHRHVIVVQSLYIVA